MKVKKQAKQDAFEYARAQMYYGEGAGNRRKLITAKVLQKQVSIPGYESAFLAALEEQDMAEHAEAAQKERRRKDVVKKVDRNVRGLTTGNRESLTTGVMILAGAIYVARQTGYDKIIVAETKKKYRQTKSWVKKQHEDYKRRKNIRPVI